MKNQCANLMKELQEKKKSTREMRFDTHTHKETETERKYNQRHGWQTWGNDIILRKDKHLEKIRATKAI